MVRGGLLIEKENANIDNQIFNFTNYGFSEINRTPVIS